MTLPKKDFNRIVAQLRKQFTWSEQYKAVKKRCMVSKDILRCEGCERHVTKYFPLETLPEGVEWDSWAVDHIEAVGTLTSLDQAADRIFCSDANLMGLCGICHFFKTRVDNEETKDKKKMSLIDRIELGELDD